MKYLLLLLIPLTLFAQSEYSVNENQLDQKKLAEAQMDKLNSMYSGVDTYCDNTGHHADLITECKKIKTAIKSQYKDRMEKQVTKSLRDGIKLRIAERQKALCVTDYQAKLTERSQTFDGSETCKQLKYAVCVYDYAKYLTDAGQTPVATTCAGLRNEWAAYQLTLQGSGSGGQ